MKESSGLCFCHSNVTLFFLLLSFPLCSSFLERKIGWKELGVKDERKFRIMLLSLNECYSFFSPTTLSYMLILCRKENWLEELGASMFWVTSGSTMLWVTPGSLMGPARRGLTSQNHGHLVDGVLLGAHSLWPTGACQLFKNTPPPIADERFCWIRYPLVTLKTILLVLYVLLRSILAYCKQ
jgi:hypothetical protein